MVFPEIVLAGLFDGVVGVGVGVVAEGGAPGEALDVVGLGGALDGVGFLGFGLRFCADDVFGLSEGEEVAEFGGVEDELRVDYRCETIFMCKCYAYNLIILNIGGEGFGF